LNRLLLLKFIDLHFHFTTILMQIVHKINNSSLCQVLAFYYVSWVLAMPKLQHLGLDFGKEFEMAKKISD
jgi:hypothetical protein